MPKYVAFCADQSGAADIRAAARSDHLAYIEGVSDQILLVGPLLSESDTVIGSLFLIEARDLNAAHAFIDNDPFTKAGLFDSIVISRFKTHLGTLL